jgi:uncharacterized membrane protein
MRADARVVSGVLAGGAYIVGSHWLMTSAPDSDWNAVALLAPMLIVIVVCAWRARQLVNSLLCAAVLAALVAQAWLGPPLPQHLLYLGQHVVIHLVLALLFGLTLRRGATALISRVALQVHGHLTPAMAAYTRKLTAVWCAYFVAMAALSLLVYATLPFDAWATFANWLTPLALALMFGGEYLLRYRLHPEFERVSMLRAIQAYAQRPQTPQQPAGPT